MLWRKKCNSKPKGMKSGRGTPKPQGTLSVEVKSFDEMISSRVILKPGGFMSDGVQNPLTERD